jgi:hypothetical protein
LNGVRNPAFISGTLKPPPGPAKLPEPLSASGILRLFACLMHSRCSSRLVAVLLACRKGLDGRGLQLQEKTMLKLQSNAAAQADPEFFELARSTDGCDETWEIICTLTGKPIASFRFWYEEKARKRDALKLIAALNALYESGGFFDPIHLHEANTAMICASHLVNGEPMKPKDSPFYGLTFVDED